MSNYYSNNTSDQGGDYYGQKQQQHSYNNFGQPQQRPNSGFQQQPQPQQSQQPANQWQPQQWQPQQPVWNMNAAASTAATMAAMAAGGGSDAMLDAGKKFIESGTARMIPGLESSMMVLRAYFAVDNRYVVRKMKKILMPFLSRHWQRLEKEPPGPNSPVVYDLPINDENAPDLYLPVMSLITYVLLCAFCYGTAGQFNPEVLPAVTTKCFVTQILEVLLIRLCFYMMQAPIAILDLFSYTGYKYLGLCINMIIGLFLSHFGFGSKGFYASFLFTASAASYFMLKTMANIIPTVTAASGPKREVVVFAVAVSQFASMWFVSQTKFL